MKHAFLALSLWVTACTYEPPHRTAEWYQNPERYEDDSAEHPRRKQFQAYLDHAVQEGLPGAVLLIRTPDEGTWVGAAGYADVANSVKWQPSTIGRVGSVTKPFAAAVMLKLAEQSRLSLDSPARDHLPQKILSNIANTKSATIRQLLNHTSGIYDYLGSSALLFEALGSYHYEYQGKAKLLEYAYDEDAEFRAGASWSYSNTNFLLLETIAERVSTQSSKALIDTLVIDALALRSTTYDPSHSHPKGMARGYGDIFADGKLIDVTESELERFHFDGGIVSNVYDMADFMDALLSDSFLSSESQESLRDVVPTKGKSKRGTDFYGAGIIVEQHPELGPVYGHSGTTIGFSAHVYRVERLGITFAAIVNASQHGMEERSYRWFSPLKYDHILRLVTGQ